MTSDAAGLQIRGGTPAARFAAAAAWAGLTDDDPADAWTRLDAGGRAWLGRRLDPARLTPAADGLTIAADGWAALRAARPPRVDLRGLGTLFPVADGPVWGQVDCGGAAGGERLFTAEWLTPGYDQGQCQGPRCPAALARALRTARGAHEALRLTLTVGSAEGGDDGATRRVRCRVRP
ncbi:MAG: hypothetical protein H6702_09130 [Myxococcales bacterium]|nr:hypothetical protein [Myxococcales bacterium]